MRLLSLSLEVLPLGKIIEGHKTAFELFVVLVYYRNPHGKLETGPRLSGIRVSDCFIESESESKFWGCLSKHGKVELRTRL
jgi:hypothetical protein